eukprot:15432898-Alexandrium_andersonii.AAC.2
MCACNAQLDEAAVKASTKARMARFGAKNPNSWRPFPAGGPSPRGSARRVATPRPWRGPLGLLARLRPQPRQAGQWPPTQC